MYKKTALILLVFLFPQIALGDWKMETRYEVTIQFVRSVLEFKNETGSVIYKPSIPPYGLVSQERLVLDDRVLFVTGWAKGARSVLFKVFYPQKNREQPLCEVVSFSETARVRIEDKTIKIEVVYPDVSDSTEWVYCYDL